MRWRVYYGDNSVFSSYDGSPFEAPQVNVQAVTFEDASERGFGLMQGKDAYYWHDNIGWSGCDSMGLFDYLMFYRGPKAVLFGRSIRDETFWAIVGRASQEGLG